MGVVNWLPSTLDLNGSCGPGTLWGLNLGKGSVSSSQAPSANPSLISLN